MDSRVLDTFSYSFSRSILPSRSFVIAGGIITVGMSGCGLTFCGGPPHCASRERPEKAFKEGALMRRRHALPPKAGRPPRAPDGPLDGERDRQGGGADRERADRHGPRAPRPWLPRR